MGKMRDHWKSIKQWSEDVAKGKIELDFMGGGGGSGAAVIKTLGKFSSGLGPTLDKVEKAYLDKKEADVKKYADAALTIVGQYATLVDELGKKGGTAASYAAMKTWLDKLQKDLGELKAKGLGASKDIVTK